MKIDKRKTYFITLDTETTSDLSPEENGKRKVMIKYIYDFGYTIADKKETLVQRNYLVKEIFENENLMNNAYYASKKKMYDNKVVNGEIQVVPFAEIIKTLQKDIKDYNIKMFGAFNVGFDIDALMQTTEFIYPKTFPLIWKKTKSGKNAPDTIKFVQKYIFKKDIEIVDIWTLACKVLCNQKTFLAYYKEKTKGGKIKSNAEIVYNYINDTKDFLEEHTALADSIIETEIWQRVLRNHKAIGNKFEFFPFRFIKEV